MRKYSVGGGWGDSILLDEKQEEVNVYRCYGWKSRIPKVGDILTHTGKNGVTGEKVLAVFQFKKIEPCENPRDMFFADIKLIGYEGMEKADSLLAEEKDQSAETNSLSFVL